MGDPAEWDVATEALRQALEAAEIPYVVAEGEGAFYAPKIDVHVRDAIGRRWQVSTLQVDFQMPHRFGLEYVGADNQRHLPHMIHRALFGSIERFFGILLEHYAGALPAWLAPVQARVLPVRDDHQPYADTVAATLRAGGHPGRRGGRRRAAGRPGPQGQAGEAALRPGRRRRRRRRRHGRRQLPGQRATRARRPASTTSSPRCGPRSTPTPCRPAKRELAGAAVGRLAQRLTSSRHGRPGRRPCVFCAILASGLPDEETHVVWRHPTGSAVAILNAYPYTSGHLMVMPTRHVGELEDLTAAEADASGVGVSQAVRALKAAYRPDGLNLGANLGRSAGAGIPGHFHLHVLPRWDGDTNFMTSVADTRVLPEALSASAGRVRAAWPGR